jgi:acyl-CoA thioesterase I
MADRRLLFFGDSLVAGAGDPTGAGWVGRVVAGAFTSGLALTAYNLGVRGETSEQVASRWRAEALPRLLPGADCRIVLSFGTNDTSVEHDRVRVKADRSLAALATILEEAATIGLPSLVVGPAPVDEPGHNGRIRSLSGSFCRGLRGARGAVRERRRATARLGRVDGAGRRRGRRASRSRGLRCSRRARAHGRVA